jgi:hypothetical protein
MPEKKEMSDPKKESFKYQLDLLKMEIEIIDKAIARLDDITQTTKNYAIVIWVGLITVALADLDFRQYTIFTVLVPLLFWVLDARWRYFLRGFIFRQDKIAEFLNSEKLVESFKEQRLVGIKVLDPRGAQYRKTDEYKKTVNFWRSMRYSEVNIIYIGLSVVSIVAGLVVIFTP